MNIRKSRWGLREMVKYKANRCGMIDFKHPQVRREIERSLSSIEEQLTLNQLTEGQYL